MKINALIHFVALGAIVSAYLVGAKHGSQADLTVEHRYAPVCGPDTYRPTCLDCLLSPDMVQYLSKQGHGKVYGPEDME